jgi:hypothetical protein
LHYNAVTAMYPIILDCKMFIKQLKFVSVYHERRLNFEAHSLVGAIPTSAASWYAIISFVLIEALTLKKETMWVGLM